jgi:5'-phosphate synthase pdxT subunit
VAGKVRIGVLALQGAVREHQLLLHSIGVDAVTVKKPEHLENIHGLILPGGESTVIGRLMQSSGLLQPLRELAAQGFPMMGTCAGLILLARQIVEQPDVYVGALNVQVKRNAFGRQRESFEQALQVEGMEQRFPAVFIRAPQIVEVDASVRVLATVDEAIVAVQQGTLWGLSFHPELTKDARFHQLFVDQVRLISSTTR